MDASLAKNCRRVKFLDSKGTAQTMAPGDVEAYFSAPDKLFYSRMITIGDSVFPAFVKVLRPGRQSLYEYKNADHHFFLLEDSVTRNVVFLTKENYRPRLKMLYGHNANAAKLIEGLRFTQYNLREFLEKTETGNYRRMPLAYVALEAGLAGTTFSTEEGTFGREPIPTDLNYTLGLSAVIPLDFSNVSLQTGLSFSKYNIKSALPEQDTFRYSFRAAQLQIPLMVRYTLKDARPRPYFATGIRFTHLFDDSHKAFSPVAKDSTVVQNLLGGGRFSKNVVQLGTCLGVEFEVAPQKVLYLEARYYYHLLRGLSEFIRNDFQFVVGFSL